ncbi:hypothetical protein AAE02nite_14330 [Adhaeribacter aerolatus]|uniref:Type IX secretion system membrane protein PorP/SprF n=1 Tax=Adhaeribacter aerolatus TaxID=670289 RepID=A0A512AVM6_9BACT|nr:PorP/SprF family type IX secretion system membrane protein [Adhaeribacter aerolatus]GEO03769.1 hypothetical protein AAE02nite_14330 [Adhaeribacter aerolatus]
MKKISLVIALFISALGAQAQSRKHITNYSLFQQYFNPAFTGHEGSVMKSFYRNQWTGFDNAPRTAFISGEFDLADLKAVESNNNSLPAGARNAMGVSLLHETFGPFKEGQLQMNYASQVRLSEKLSLRAGAALTYAFVKLDYNMLTLDQSNDPEYQAILISDNKSDKVDVNVGLMLTAENFYLGYGLQDAAKGKIVSSGYYLHNGTNTQHLVQAGFRKSLSEQFGVVVNGIYRYDSTLKETVEGQVKGIFNNTFWAGAGYRHDLAYTLTAGLQLGQLKVGYAYETATRQAKISTRSSNELIATYNLFSARTRNADRPVSIW